jgi:hypothetical protein
LSLLQPAVQEEGGCGRRGRGKKVAFGAEEVEVRRTRGGEEVEAAMLRVMGEGGR